MYYTFVCPYIIYCNLILERTCSTMLSPVFSHEWKNLCGLALVRCPCAYWSTLYFMKISLSILIHSLFREDFREDFLEHTDPLFVSWRFPCAHWSTLCFVKISFSILIHSLLREDFLQHTDPLFASWRYWRSMHRLLYKRTLHGRLDHNTVKNLSKLIGLVIRIELTQAILMSQFLNFLRNSTIDFRLFLYLVIICFLWVTISLLCRSIARTSLSPFTN